MRISDWSSDVCSSDLTAGEQRQSLDLLAHRSYRDLYAGGQRRLRVGQRDTSGAAGEQDREDLREGLPGVLERREEDRLHPLVQLIDDRHEIRAGLCEVGELLGEEGVALFERGVLLEGERIDATELPELALGIREAAALGGPLVRHGARQGTILEIGRAHV